MTTVLTRPNPNDSWEALPASAGTAPFIKFSRIFQLLVRRVAFRSESDRGALGTIASNMPKLDPKPCPKSWLPECVQESLVKSDYREPRVRFWLFQANLLEKLRSASVIAWNLPRNGALNVLQAVLSPGATSHKLPSHGLATSTGRHCFQGPSKSDMKCDR